MKTLLKLTLCVLISSPAFAQWARVPPTPIPVGPDGKPNLVAPSPRLPDGKPDLSGIWEAQGGYNQDLAKDLKDVPFQPWAKTLAEERSTGSREAEDPTANCLPQGVPRINAVPPPWRIIQTPRYMAILYEAFHSWRQIFLDGQELGDDFDPAWLGYSTG